MCIRDRCCFYHQENTQNFYFCNVINNKVSKDGDGIFYLYEVTFSVNHCFYKGNNASNLSVMSNEYFLVTVNECHFEENTFPTDKYYIKKSSSMTELNLSNLYSPYLCALPNRTKIILHTEGSNFIHQWRLRR